MNINRAKVYLGSHGFRRQVHGNKCKPTQAIVETMEHRHSLYICSLVFCAELWLGSPMNAVNLSQGKLASWAR